MTKAAPSSRLNYDAPRASARGAFTFIELVAVMILVGILGISAAVSFNSMPASRQASAARQVHRDLAFARERSMATGVRHWVVFSTPTNSYSVLAEDPLNPGRINATTMIDPASQGPFVQRLNLNEFVGVSLDSAIFDVGTEVGFDWLGEPLNSTAAPLAVSGVVQVAGGHQVIVQSGTGMVTYAAP